MICLYHKVHETAQGKVLACCDKELIGKELSQGELVLEINSDFYGQEEIEVKRLVELISEVSSANLLGARAVRTVVEKGIVEEADVREIAGVPHVQIFKV